ncbi:regulatory protein SUAPRGA1 [Penicillium alfredii]|uniref:Regulatory protein SUAPRGA1 n=1 Tax=Penicillium alfredii TaxID=1506179 RepID=A0A9W9GAB3_9EURO|nr:regulatory protein SUAPRGA1 [Penicillium alfredii]KAJ5115043.1 regulatory protein SUAPRGA1 [Penicillium alfredii]
MLSLRTIARSVPRAIPRSIAGSALRPVSRIPSALPQPWKQTIKPAYAAFSTSSIRKEPASEGDVDLLSKLNEELSHESETDPSELKDQQESIDAFLKDGNWQVKDVEGEQEVVLSKKFGNETIRITFTVADINNLSEQEFEDNALGDEDDFSGHQSINQGRGNDIAQHSEDRVSPADRELDDLDRMPEPSFPSRVNITVEKPNQGALLIQTTAQDGAIQIEDVSHFSKPELAHAQTAEKDWTRQNLYAGPAFENLDEELQALWERYLADRGIDSALASLVPDYIAVKEQKEYVRWLSSVKNFIGA